MRHIPIRPMPDYPKAPEPAIAAGRSLDPDSAFVVQFRSGPVLDPRSHPGRVEHVSSGQALQFGSAQELMDFVERMLTRIRPPR